MADLKTAEEVFQVAMSMEKVGLDFYSALANVSDHQDVRAFCSDAAKAEKDHYEAFHKMLETWRRVHGHTPLAPEAIEKLLAGIKAKVVPNPKVVQQVALRGHAPEAMAMALQMEQDSVEYYQDMLGLMPSLGAQIRPIIEEEKAHVRRIQAFKLTD